MILDFNLAPLKYAKELEKKEFIKDVFVVRTQILPGIMGYEAKCYLQPKYQTKTKYHFHANCDGAGSSTKKNIAIYKSISEALERFAFRSISHRGPTIISTDGFAAFPSLLGKFAKLNSYYEALERYYLKLFNIRALALKKDTLQGITYYHYLDSKGAFVITTTRFNNFFVYGFAAGPTLKSAKESALIELWRNRDSFKKKLVKESPLLQEQRILFFASEDGYQHFHDLTASAQALKSPVPRLNTYSTRIAGIWDHITKVYFTRFLEDKLEKPHELKYFYF